MGAWPQSPGHHDNATARNPVGNHLAFVPMHPLRLHLRIIWSMCIPH